MSDLRVIQGIVTCVDEILCTFDVCFGEEDVVIVHAAFIETLPRINICVTVKSAYFTLNDMVLTSENDLRAIITNKSPKTRFLDLVKELRLTPTDLLKFACNYRKLSTFFVSPHGFENQDIILNVLENLKNVKFQFQSLKALDCISRDRETYKDFSYWTPSTHWNWSKKLLIGLFVFDRKTGNLYFTDSSRQIPCVIVNKKDEIQNFLYCYVLIEDFIYNKEIYNGTKFSVMDYLLIDPTKIIKLMSYSEEHFFYDETSPELGSHLKFSCRIISKSQAIQVSTRDVVQWLEVVLEDKVNAYLRLSPIFKKFFSILLPNRDYYIFYKTKPQRIRNDEIERLSKMGNHQKSTVVFYELMPDSHFVPKNLNLTSRQVVRDVSAANRDLSKNLLITFEGLISLKLFVDSLPSRTPAITNDPHFGTPGEKTQKLRFDTTGKPLEVYLNNWENLSCVCGLISNMRVLVCNVLPQKNRYYKSTLLTSIEVLSYEPKVRFESASLFSPDWGLPYCLGAGLLIPTFTVIWGTVLSFFVLGLKIEIDSTAKLTGQITLIVFDYKGESKVIAKNEVAVKLLRLLLGLNGPAFNKWVEGFKNMGSFCYSKGDQLQEQYGKAKKTLQRYFQNFEKRSKQMDLMCRKMDNDQSGKPIYFLLDARL